ncbi:hypothetical protein BpHYR1_050284 [Brachionus plicatilis]|uniref:Uncharacterized protein n=1 Tax=Brachionus plicatilis TaxID=10195 RepID=A0A3M7SW15_BRAPC|nr:hypothetical protein BpHYR1_050284 [Brachionus plicatilis]
MASLKLAMSNVKNVLVLHFGIIRYSNDRSNFYFKIYQKKKDLQVEGRCYAKMASGTLISQSLISIYLKKIFIRLKVLISDSKEKLSLKISIYF